jgi:two-component system, LytTR family, sensor kinase
LAASILNISKHRWYFAAAFLLLVAIQVQVLRGIGLSLQTALGDSSITNIFLGTGCFLMTNNLRFYLPRKHQYAILIVWSLSLSAFTTTAAYWVLRAVFSNDTAYILALNNSMTIRFWIAVLIISWVAIVSVLWYRQQESNEAEKRKSAAEKLAREAELYKLRQQLQPHFLFNSLNSISALAGSRPEQARKMIHQLAEFLRGTLRKEEHQWVTLADELQHLGLYLEIEKVRFGHRLDTQITSDPEAGSLKLPPMLLQPLVENAIKFGLYDTTDAIAVKITAKKEQEYLWIEVQNPFDPETTAPKQGTGFGLSSVQRRLYLLFARNDLLATRTKENLFITTVKIPQHDQSVIDR